jgi:aspartate/methionine/tyrosine aminotransferase
LEKLAEYISKFKDCIVIEDLVYAEFAPEKSFTPFYHILPERTIVVSSLSKAYRSTGMRCGFVSTSEKFNNWFSRNAGQNFRDRMGLIKSPDNIGAFSHTHHLSRPVQYAGTFKLIESLVDDQNMSSFVAELKRRWTAFQEIVSLPVKESFVPYYILTDIEQWIKKSSRNDISTPEDFFLKLAREKGVVLLPAASFFVNKEIEHKWFARVSTANVNYEQTTEAANRIKDFLGI